MEFKAFFCSVIGVTRESMSLSDTVKACVTQLEQEHQMVNITTEYVDSELARLYETSERANVRHRIWSWLFKESNFWPVFTW